MWFIDKQSKLNDVVKRIAVSKRLAVDTEADSLHHYYEKLCLLQISTPDEDFVFDPLSGLDLKKIIEAMNDKILIVHGADFDLRMLRKAYGFIPKDVFDTKLAAQFLGYQKPSLAHLVDHHFNVKLPKANQKADWSKRPLTPSMLEYASNDTHFLHDLRNILDRELRNMARNEWYKQSCTALIASIEAKSSETKKERAWLVKGWKALKGRELVLLHELWQWREIEAQRRDKPRFKILSTEQMLKMAKWASGHQGKSLKACPSTPVSFRDGKIGQLDKLIVNAWNNSVDNLIVEDKNRPHKKRFTNRQKAVLQSMKNERKIFADNIKLDPSLLASNASLENLVLASPKNLEEFAASQCLLKWQTSLIAENFLKILNSHG